jgi:ketosteroid isomerase-like protein
MAVTDVASGLVGLCKELKFDEAIAQYYSDDIVSVEAMGDPATVQGMDAVKAKSAMFAETMEIHSCEVGGPYINGDQFAVRFTLDTTNKMAGKKMLMDEIAVYTVKDDKIVHEVFLYGG